MSRRLLVVNIVAAALACLFVGGLAREALSTRRLPAPPVPRPAPPAAATPERAAPSPPGGYAIIPAKNLFSPARSEAPAGPVVVVGPKPVLHGVVMDGGRSRAYLEDPATRRTFGYAVGDSIGGGRAETISADRVVIARPDGLVEILLRDPSKPKPPPAPVTAGQSGVPQAPPATAATPAAAAGATRLPGLGLPQALTPGLSAAVPVPRPGQREQR